jgi:hypothetical protein
MSTTETNQKLTMNYYKITQIDFDFDGEDLTQDEMDSIITEAKSCLWDVPNLNEFGDAIYRNLGYTVTSLQYDVIN